MSRRSSRPLAAQNLDVEHFRAALEGAAEEARGFSLRETADVGACKAKCGVANAQVRSCRAKLDNARAALLALSDEVKALREKVESGAASGEYEAKDFEGFFNDAEELLKAVPKEAYESAPPVDFTAERREDL